MADKTWPLNFGPSFTPEQMLKQGIFEGKYINNIKGIPASWKKIDKVLGPNDEPDPKINKYGVKSRQPLSTWKQNGWIKTDKNGWFEWYIHFYLGRRLGQEDEWQIGRWRSFVARHQGQINASQKAKQQDSHLVQKQGLLQWGWDWHDKFTDEQVLSNAKSLARSSGVPIEKLKKAEEAQAIELPIWMHW